MEKSGQIHLMRYKKLTYADVMPNRKSIYLPGRLIPLFILCHRKGQSTDGGPTLKWSEVHTLIYRGCPVGGGSPLNGGINKSSLHMDQLFTHFTCNEVNKTYAVTIKMKVHFIYFPSNCVFKLFARF